ncbi:MAG: hypothetical protein JXA03_12315 [Bacteroidales bacterium]|nr:hypothetical protein [Bacteroidales bacterium]
MQLLRTILIILLVYYIFRFFIRYVIPFLLFFIRKTAEKRFHDRKNGDVSAGHIPEKRELSNDVGEYVDFVEIKTKEKDK